MLNIPKPNKTALRQIKKYEGKGPIPICFVTQTDEFPQTLFIYVPAAVGNEVKRVLNDLNNQLPGERPVLTHLLPDKKYHIFEIQNVQQPTDLAEILSHSLPAAQYEKALELYSTSIRSSVSNVSRIILDSLGLAGIIGASSFLAYYDFAQSLQPYMQLLIGGLEALLTIGGIALGSDIYKAVKQR